MTILLTGASGFVGSYVRAVVPCIPLVDPDGIEVDLRDQAHVVKALSQRTFDAVIHLAAQSSIPASFADPKTTYDINFFGTYNLLLSLKQTGFQGRILYVGTSEEYGEVDDMQLPVTELQPLRPRNPYAVSKVAAEALCCQWNRTGNLDIVCARPFNHIGPGQAASYLVPSIARQVIAIRHGLQPAEVVLGNLDVTRDILDVRDVVSAYLMLLANGRSGEVYNVCSGIEHSVRGLATMLLSEAGVEARLRTEDGLVRPQEQKRMFGNNARLRDATGWHPEIPLVQTLKDVLHDWEVRQR